MIVAIEIIKIIDGEFHNKVLFNKVLKTITNEKIEKKTQIKNKG